VSLKPIDQRLARALPSAARHRVWLVLALTAAGVQLRADSGLFNYEGNQLPGSRGSGLLIFDACDGNCSGHLV